MRVRGHAGGGGGCWACFRSGPISVGGGGGSKRSAPLFPGPQEEPAHGLHPRFVVAEIRADRVWVTGWGGGGGALSSYHNGHGTFLALHCEGHLWLSPKSHTHHTISGMVHEVSHALLDHLRNIFVAKVSTTKWIGHEPPPPPWVPPVLLIAVAN